MRNDKYFKHDASASCDEKLMNLIANEGLKGYGAYWVLMEALRKETDFRASMEHVKILAFRFRIKSDYLLHIVRDFDLFVIENGYFFSRGMLTRLKAYVDKLKENTNEKSVKEYGNHLKNNSERTVNVRANKEKIRLKLIIRG